MCCNSTQLTNPTPLSLILSLSPYSNLQFFSSLILSLFLSSQLTTEKTPLDSFTALTASLWSALLMLCPFTDSSTSPTLREVEREVGEEERE